METTHIRVKEETKKKLDELVSHKGQTYDEIINDVIKTSGKRLAKTEEGGKE